MSLTEEVVRDLVRAWAVHDIPLAADRLSDDFVFRSSIEVFGKADFVSGWKAQAPWATVQVLAVLIGERVATVFFEGIDPTTNLGHRFAWLLEHTEARVTRLTELSAILR